MLILQSFYKKSDKEVIKNFDTQIFSNAKLINNGYPILYIYFSLGYSTTRFGCPVNDRYPSARNLSRRCKMT